MRLHTEEACLVEKESMKTKWTTKGISEIKEEAIYTRGLGDGKEVAKQINKGKTKNKTKKEQIAPLVSEWVSEWVSE